jgi:DNA polymerase I-like protein with 3'-5' exonuclease and polymerase domains
MLRPALIPGANRSLVVADWSGIEARVNPWLSNCDAGIEKLSLFARGEDVYKVNASATFHVSVEEVTSDQRQIGKVQELACGFAGGIGGMIMAKSTGLVLDATQGNYTIIFAICTTVYFLAVAAIHLLSPRLAKVEVE